MGGSALEILTNKELLEKIKKEWRELKNIK